MHFAVLLNVVRRWRIANARAEAEAANLLKDEFLATLAHELRNPLAPLRNVSEILRLEVLSDTARQATGVMNRQIAQLVRLIDDLMDVSRITRGHLTLQRHYAHKVTMV